MKVNPGLLNHEVDAYKNRGFHPTLSGYFLVNGKPIYVQKTEYLDKDKLAVSSLFRCVYKMPVFIKTDDEKKDEDDEKKKKKKTILNPIQKPQNLDSLELIVYGEFEKPFLYNHNLKDNLIKNAKFTCFFPGLLIPLMIRNERVWETYFGIGEVISTSHEGILTENTSIVLNYNHYHRDPLCGPDNKNYFPLHNYTRD